MGEQRPIIIQGAMELELEELLRIIKIEREETINNFRFYFGEIDSYPIILSLTQIGVVNACMATMIAIQKFDPLLVINQGVAGAHVDYIHRNDIVIGEKCVNINAYITSIKNKGEGSNPLEWIFNSRVMEYATNKELVDIAKKVSYDEHNLFIGTLGSGDIFNREVDRIEWIHNNKNTLCEDNESIAVYQICDTFKVKCIGFRTITNNEYTQAMEDGATISRLELSKNSNKLLSRTHDEAPATISQRYTLDFVKEFLRSIKQ